MAEDSTMLEGFVITTLCSPKQPDVAEDRIVLESVVVTTLCETKQPDPL